MKNIIACIDGANSTTSTCEASAWVANKVEAPLVLFHALDHSTQPVVSEFSGQIGLGSQEELLEELAELDEARSKIMLKHGNTLLEEAQKWALNQGVKDVSKLQRHGSLLEGLLDLEEELRVLVIGRSGDSHSVGSQLETVIRSIKAHILVVCEGFKLPDSYLIAFDGSAISEKLIDKAIQTPLLKGLDCHLVMIDDGGSKDAAFEKARVQLEESGIKVTAASLTGAVDKALIDYQQQHEIGMMVMGAYGHSQLRQFFVGSNTTKVLSNSSVPLLLIR
ncbi:universal stress protein UspA [Vibrio splendidus]|uniref:universal stress protein n=1 Tax=Vibrio lentus TaxID=136468 RepID=UPI000C08C028|nr:universal stress protein [Vibrio lentus]PHN87576.1 universal stress protein UspA [Vibrio splendidus]MCC4814985.1 universal stress protein [Vibrio lentus]PMG74637.1 universal stress protein UspA [Vibrio lentus]PMJ87033.1 universal stress protein UspA [Vibrio lentus]PMK88630.1 universal stress protein UspA [Vibrio lentus]